MAVAADEVVRRGRGEPPRPGPADLHAVVVGLLSWASALVTVRLGWAGLAALGGVASVLVLHRRRPDRWAWLVVILAVGGSAVIHREQPRASVVDALARDQATVEVRAVLTGDPVVRPGRFGPYVLVRARVDSVVGRGRVWQVSAPVLVLGPLGWARAELGETVAASGRLAPSQSVDLAAVMSARGPPRRVASAGLLVGAAARLRTGIRVALARSPEVPSKLVPALVDGDASGLSEDVQQQFRTTGLTHLLAVSGTNLTLVVGFLLVLARGVGVRARGLVVVGALGVAGFVLLARPEPSVLRAAAMGSVALVGMSAHGRERGTRALGVAVALLMLWDPWLADSPGFALSALATAGILFLAPGWRAALGRWLPRPVAEGLAVPMAAQLACTPLVAALSGQVSLVAVVANVLAEPAVAPATVLGLVGGVLSTVWAPLGQLPGLVAGWCGAWIVLVASKCAALPTAAIGWSTGPGSLTVLSLLCVLLAVSARRVLARRGVSLVLAATSVVVVVVPLPTPGWPPPGWVLVACDIGQGDGLVLNAGQGAGVVVDTGPDPSLMDHCLRRLGITSVPLVVLTHFHSDHVDGLPGVLHGRRVGAIEVTTLASPTAGVRAVHQEAARAGVPVRPTRLRETVRAGPLVWRTLGPAGSVPPDSDSPPNDASIVMYVRSRGISMLLMGDEETPSQERLATLVPGLHVDVLKVAHHGSAKQDPALIDELGARLALISCGLDNSYGHPAPSTLAVLRSAGIEIARTDTEGDLAVVVDPGGGLRLATRIPTPRPQPGK